MDAFAPCWLVVAFSLEFERLPVIPGFVAEISHHLVNQHLMWLVATVEFDRAEVEIDSALVGRGHRICEKCNEAVGRFEIVQIDM